MSDYIPQADDVVQRENSSDRPVVVGCLGFQDTADDWHDNDETADGPWMRVRFPPQAIEWWVGVSKEGLLTSVGADNARQANDRALRDGSEGLMHIKLDGTYSIDAIVG